MICLIFPSSSQLAFIGLLLARAKLFLNMKIKKVEKVITTLKDRSRIGHPLTLFHIGGEGGWGEADSALLQIAFFITSVRDTAESRNLVTFIKFSLSHVIWPYLVRAHAKKWSVCIYITIPFEILVQNG